MLKFLRKGTVSKVLEMHFMLEKNLFHFLMKQPFSKQSTRRNELEGLDNTEAFISIFILGHYQKCKQ